MFGIFLNKGSVVGIVLPNGVDKNIFFPFLRTLLRILVVVEEVCGQKGLRFDPAMIARNDDGGFVIF